METVAQTSTFPELNIVYYSDMYIYSTNGHQVYRIPNDTTTITFGHDDFPLELLDSFFSDVDEIGICGLPISTISKDIAVTQIENAYFSTDYIETAIRILGDNARFMIVRSDGNCGLRIWSDAGDGFIMPIRVFIEN